MTPLDADLVRILHAVAIRIDPDPVADRAQRAGRRVVGVTGRRPVVAEVGGQVLLAGSQVTMVTRCWLAGRFSS